MNLYSGQGSTKRCLWKAWRNQVVVRLLSLEQNLEQETLVRKDLKRFRTKWDQLGTTKHVSQAEKEEAELHCRVAEENMET